ALGEEKPADRLRRAESPTVQVVFVLDTTGSMSGLIEGAKVKVWRIVNQIVSGKPVPEVEVGLVAYRDRGDSYVTRLTAMTNDLDKVYGVLKGFAAGGGGDEPESVNEALDAALTKFAWSRDSRTLRIIYLVGDAAPHMDYPNDVKYPVTCEAAARAGIIINTVQCGANSRTTPIWQEIARKAEGRYVQIDQSGGMTSVATPFDGRIAALSSKLSGTAVFYGDRRERDKAREDLLAGDAAAAEAPAEAKAERAGYRAKSGSLGANDLLALIEDGKVEIDKIEKKQLPEELQKLDADALKKRIDELIAERKKIRAELLELDKKRAEHIEKELAQKGDKDSFDEKVLDMLREQAKRIGVKYE
ncbi:MAG: vWA domain-containing protein, partial [Planctomycetota bacterium]